jgi:hypothetical protein
MRCRLPIRLVFQSATLSPTQFESVAGFGDADVLMVISSAEWM